MKPDWDELGDKYEKSKKVLIGDVDCTRDDSKKLCEDQGVTGYPTIKSYSPGERVGEVYEGERTLDAFKAFVKTLGPPCGPKHLNKCTEAQKAELETYMAMDLEALHTKLGAMEKALEDEKATHEALLKSLQAQFEASNKKLTALKEESNPAIKLMRVAGQHRVVASSETAEPEPAQKKEL